MRAWSWLLVLLLFWPEPQARDSSPGDRPRPDRGLGAPLEAPEYQALLTRFGRPRPRGLDARSWAGAQVRAIEGFLRRFPASPRRFRLYQWWAVNELEILGRPERAEGVLRRMLREAPALPAPEARAVRLRALRLLVRLYARIGDRRAEREVLERLLAHTSGLEARHWRARLFALRHLRPGHPFPGFAARTLEGRPVSSRDARGKVLVLRFWDPEDPADRREARLLAAVVAAARGAVVVLDVPLCRHVDRVLEVARGERLPGPQIWDPERPGNDHPLVTRYGALSGSRTYLVDPQGVLRAVDLRGEKLCAAVWELLGAAEATR